MRGHVLCSDLNQFEKAQKRRYDGTGLKRPTIHKGRMLIIFDNDILVDARETVRPIDSGNEADINGS